MPKYMLLVCGKAMDSLWFRAWLLVNKKINLCKNFHSTLRFFITDTVFKHTIHDLFTAKRFGFCPVNSHYSTQSTRLITKTTFKKEMVWKSM